MECTHTCTMKSTAVFMLLSGIAMLLQLPVDCELCPAVSEDVYAFINGTSEQYLDIVEKHTTKKAIIENAKILKECVDSKLTKEDKDAAVNLVTKIINFCKLKPKST
ncbi:major allergen I polypeptide chain 1-like [Antechinus flavipes]|uniref:major allergen I polypeptide chain 1-like n=1 Tax=Antechinus flavipes TaxID=38775 RepID=UPI002235C860|nr:major allergen I polypeptide chain 1-like [Antechinus flavipes]